MRSGKLPENVLNRSIYNKFTFKRSDVLTHARVGENCALLSLAPNNCVLTSVTAEADHEGFEKHALIKALNSLTSKGAEPVGIMSDILVPESFEETDLKALNEKLGSLCRELRLELLHVDTKASRAVLKPFFDITAVGTVPPDVSFSGAAPGQDVVITKRVGLLGTSIIATLKEEELSKVFPPHMIYEAKYFDEYQSTASEAAPAGKSGVTAMYSLSEGGIFAGLWELAECYGVGLEIDVRKIPIKQETIEICNYFDINPYVLDAGGSLLMTTSDGNALLLELRKLGIEAAVIGKVTDSNDRVLINEDTRRFLEPSKQDELYKILN